MWCILKPALIFLSSSIISYNNPYNDTQHITVIPTNILAPFILPPSLILTSSLTYTYVHLRTLTGILSPTPRGALGGLGGGGDTYDRQKSNSNSNSKTTLLLSNGTMGTIDISEPINGINGINGSISKRESADLLLGLLAPGMSL